jgi:hypothetical protein
MKSLLGLLVGALVVVGITACGGVSKSASASSKASSGVSTSSGAASTSAVVTGGKAEGDYDNDDNPHVRVDDDKPSIRSYGHEARPPDKATITTLVKRYYAAAAAGDGAKACAMISSGIARAVPLDYGQSGPPYLHGGKTCAAVLSLLFKHDHGRLATEVPQLKVPSVRLEGNNGFVLLRFGRMPERQIAIEREGGVWKMEELIDGKMRHVP